VKSDPRDPHHPTAHPAPEDGRSAHDLSPEENANLCAGCVKCCTYITVQIDNPRAAWEYDQWIWALHHRGVSLYLEKPEAWFLHFETVCDHLGAEGRCAIHGNHPVLCRDYDPRSCERRLPLADIVRWFDNGSSLEAWLRERRPAHFRRLLEHRRGMPAGPPRAEAARSRPPAAALISIGEPVAGLRTRGPNAVPHPRQAAAPAARRRSLR
jgi:Fe-S-cluster containining protein